MTRRSAPSMRLVDQLSGKKAGPSAFWAALKEADEYLALEQDNIALTTRVDELEDALREEKQHAQALWVENQQLRTALARAENARDRAEAKNGGAL